MTNDTHIFDALNALCYEERLNWYTGQIEIAGVQVALYLSPDADQGLEPALRRAREVLAEFAAYHRRAEEYAVQELQPLKNEYWLEDLGNDEEPPLKAEQFTSRMTLEALVFEPDGDVTFYYDDGDLFFGHEIEVGMDATDAFVHADIPG